VHDVNLLDEILPEAGAFYVMDRGYVDFQRLFVLTLSSAFFVVRTKSNLLLLLLSGGQEHGRLLGPDRDSVFLRVGLGVPRRTTKGELLRC
jgi:hypothetical protein